MTRTLLILTAILAILSGCTLSRSTPPPASVDLTGATALYLQASAGSKSITAPDGAVLMKLLAAGTGEATFLNDKDEPVTVTVNRTLQLTDDYLLLDFAWADGSMVAMVTLSTGELRAPSALPDSWENIRVKGGTAYWISAGAITRTDLASLVQVDMSQGDRISGGSLIYLDASENVHTLNLVTGSVSPLNQVRIYYADGSPFDALGWGSPDGVLFCEWYGEGSAIEDQATGRVYHVHAGVGGFQAQEITFDETGVYLGPVTILDAARTGMHYRLAPAAGKAYLQDVAFYDSAKAARLVVDGAGVITGATVRDAACYNVPATYADGVLYAADASGVNTVDMETGAGAQLTAAAGITALEVVSGQVFYSKADGLFRYDPVADTTELVSADPAEILAVTR